MPNPMFDFAERMVVLRIERDELERQLKEVNSERNCYVPVYHRFI
jgi:hypothetical protein